jgi:hypothetical protein
VYHELNMNPILHVSPGDWGGADPCDVYAIAKSAAGKFSVAVHNEEIIAITIEPIAINKDPITCSKPNQLGDWVVGLNVRGYLWAKLAYQFAHEFCHVLAGPGTWNRDQFAWIEEAICETASLFALYRMAKSWTITPPYSHWLDYSTHLETYAADRISDRATSLPDEFRFTDWLVKQLPLLKADPYRREDNTIVAKELLPIFESEPAIWRAVRYLHHFERSNLTGITDFVYAWKMACPVEIHPMVESIAAVFDAT